MNKCTDTPVMHKTHNVKVNHKYKHYKFLNKYNFNKNCSSVDKNTLTCIVKEFQDWIFVFKSLNIF